MILYIECPHKAQRAQYRINSYDDLSSLYEAYPHARHIALLSDDLNEAVHNIADYISNHWTHAWVESSDFQKSIRSVMAGLGVLGALTIGGGKIQAVQHPKADAQGGIAPKLGTQPEDDFLNDLMQIESSGGKNLKHKKITKGPHAGQTAFGRWGLLPSTVREFAGRLGSAQHPSVKKLKHLNDSQIHDTLSKNPHLELHLARAVARHVLTNNKGHVHRAAYSWNQGHNITPSNITSADLNSSDYIKKFNAVQSKKGYVPASHVLKNETLGKGVMQRIAPVSRTPKKPPHIGHWQTGDGDREQIPFENDPAIRTRMLHKLSSKTQVRIHKDGKREFLLHRGENPDHSSVQLPSRSDPFFTHTESSSWTPHFGVAHDHARENASNEGTPHAVHSAWIHEDKIVSIPNQYGALDHWGEGPKARGQNEYHAEHEVIVKPWHDSELHNSTEVTEDTPYYQFTQTAASTPSIDQRINMRAKAVSKSETDPAQLAFANRVRAWVALREEVSRKRHDFGTKIGGAPVFKPEVKEIDPNDPLAAIKTAIKGAKKSP